MNKLKRFRKELGLTQVQAAKVCGVSRRTYQTYEGTANNKEMSNSFIEKLQSFSVSEKNDIVYNLRQIRNMCKEFFSEYPEVECAYLFGSYARGEATSKSDIDIVVVCPPSGFKFFDMAATLEEHFHKEIDIHIHHQLLRNEELMKEVLKEGIKIYCK